jgi:hypothetical protein
MLLLAWRTEVPYVTGWGRDRPAGRGVDPAAVGFQGTLNRSVTKH